MLCSSCITLATIPINKLCIRCKGAVSVNIFVLCQNCSDAAKQCSICLKKVQPPGAPRSRGCGCGNK